MIKHYIARFSTREDYEQCKKPRYEHVYYESGPLKNQLIYEGLKPKKELVVPSKTPIMGICGLPVGSVDPNKMYIGNKFSMPLVGGGRDLIAPFEYDSFESAMEDIEGGHKFGIAFDFPIPVDAVEWKVVLYSHYDGSRRAIAKDVDWNVAKIYWFAALGLISEVKFYLDVHIKQRLKLCDIKLPSEYSINDCAEYNYIHPQELLDKHGDVDRFASMF